MCASSACPKRVVVDEKAAPAFSTVLLRTRWRDERAGVSKYQSGRTAALRWRFPSGTRPLRRAEQAPQFRTVSAGDR